MFDGMIDPKAPGADAPGALVTGDAWFVGSLRAARTECAEESRDIEEVKRAIIIEIGDGLLVVKGVEEGGDIEEIQGAVSVDVDEA